MVLTRDFKELVQKRASRDPAFLDALRRDGVDRLLLGDALPNRTSPTEPWRS